MDAIEKIISEIKQQGKQEVEAMSPVNKRASIKNSKQHNKKFC